MLPLHDKHTTGLICPCMPWVPHACVTASGCCGCGVRGCRGPRCNTLNTDAAPEDVPPVCVDFSCHKPATQTTIQTQLQNMCAYCIWDWDLAFASQLHKGFAATHYLAYGNPYSVQHTTLLLEHSMHPCTHPTLHMRREQFRLQRPHTTCHQMLACIIILLCTHVPQCSPPSFHTAHP